jgi:predicted TPR repeat methyltransferase
MPYFQCAGFDLHAGILEIARAKLPGIPLFQADLRSFTVPEPVDALLCLFSAIGYLLSREDLSAFARAAAQAVKPGGMLIIEPWLTEENWQTGRPTLQTYSSTDLQLARATVAEKDGQLAIMDMNWLIARRNQPIQHLVDRHVMWLCPHAVLVEVFTEAGFAARFEPDGLMKDRGLLLGVRR